jgi:hypothetical protein
MEPTPIFLNIFHYRGSLFLWKLYLERTDPELVMVEVNFSLNHQKLTKSLSMLVSNQLLPATDITTGLLLLQVLQDQATQTTPQ